MKTKKFLSVLLSLLAFKLNLDAQIYAPQHVFTNTPDGANPKQIVLAGNLFYGLATTGGSPTNNGTIFTATPGGNYATLFNFPGGTNASSPTGLLVTNGMIYGVTKGYGTNFGCLFSLNTNGSNFTVIHMFTATPDAKTPYGNPILVGNNLYGTAASGGSKNYGGIYSINTNGGNYAVLYSFSNSPDGSAPQACLAAINNTLYGTTSSGGSNNYGCIFKINTDGTGYGILHSFTAIPDGHNPNSGLTVFSNVLYGSTYSGGSNNSGTLFKITTNASYSVIYNFASTNGIYPRSELTPYNGRLYGETTSGGIGGSGTLFQINANGTGYNVLKNFAGNGATPPDGAMPYAPVVVAGNTLWGTTLYGGLPSQSVGSGLLFQVGMPAPYFPAIPNHNYYETNLTTTNLCIPIAITETNFNSTNAYNPTNFTVSITGSDTNLIVSATRGLGSNFTLNCSGIIVFSNANLTLTVTDTNNITTSQQFQLTKITLPPVIANLANQQFNLGTTNTIPFSAFDNLTGTNLAYTVTTASTNLTCSLNLTNGLIQVTSSTTTTNPQTVTLTATDSLGGTAAQNFQVSVLPADLPADRVPILGGWNPGCIGTNGQTYKTTGTFVPPVNLTNLIDVTQPPYNAVGDGIHDDTTNIQAAIAAGDNSVIYLPAGTYLISSPLQLANSSWPWNWQAKILRGAGPAYTHIVNNNNWNCAILASGGGFLTGNGQTQPLATTCLRGSTTLTTTTSWDLAWNQQQWGIIYQPNNSQAGLPWSGGAGYEWGAKCQVVHILSQNPTNHTVVFDPPAYFDWDTNAVFTHCAGANNPIGIEDLSVESTNCDYNPNIQFYAMFNCWIKNVESKNAAGWHIGLKSSSRCTIVDSFIHGYYPASGVGGGNSDYGVEIFGQSCENLTINNCFDRTRHAMVVEDGDTGNVFAYNYSQNPINQNQESTDYLMGDMLQHGCTQWNLWEGNIAADFRMDNVLGGSTYNMCYRNNMTRSSLPATRYARWGYDIQTDNFNISIIGSVMDAVGYIPSCRVGAPDGNQDWMFGQNPDWTGGTFPIPAPADDPRPTLFVNGLVDLEMNTLSWANTNAIHPLPASLFLNQAPSFWPTNTPWPAIGPDVAGYKNIIPAMARYASLTIQANPDNYTVIRNTATNLFPLLNDSTSVQGADTTLIGISALNNPSAGTVSLNSDGQSFSFTPNASFLGTTTLTYTMTDGFATAQSTVTIAIVPNPTNQPPVLSAIPNQQLTAGFAQSISFTISDDLTPANNLLLTTTSSDPNANCSILGAGNTRTLLITGSTPNTRATVTVTATDWDLASTTSLFQINTSANPNSFPISNLTLTNNILTFNIQGPSNATWNIYTSTNLTTWNITDTLTFDNIGAGAYSITPNPNCFYKTGDGTNFSRTIGILQITSVPGLNTFANQLDCVSNDDPTQNTLDNIFSWTPLPANTIIGSLINTNTVTWNGTTWSTCQTLSPGQAATLQNNTRSNIVTLLIGYVQNECLTNLISQAPTPVSSALPLAGGISSNLCYQPASGDIISTWNTTNQNWNSVQYLDMLAATAEFSLDGTLLPSGWYDVYGNQQAEPQIIIGEGFAIQATAPNENWVQSYIK